MRPKPSYPARSATAFHMPTPCGALRGRAARFYCNTLSRYTRFNSPYYKETHRLYRQRVRDFVEERIMPTYTLWRGESNPPRDIYLEMGRHGFLAAMVGPPFPVEYVDAGACPRVSLRVHRVTCDV